MIAPGPWAGEGTPVITFIPGGRVRMGGAPRGLQLSVPDSRAELHSMSQQCAAYFVMSRDTVWVHLPH